MIAALLVVILTFWVGWAAAVTRYVDNTAADCANYDPATRLCGSGPSINRNTVNEGLALTVTGDTLFIRSGTYTERMDSNVTTFPFGTSWSNAPLISNYQGETVTIRPASGIVMNLAIQPGVSDQIQYLIFNGLILDGINQTSDSHDGIGNHHEPPIFVHHIRIQNCEIVNTYSNGILGGGPFWEILNNHIHSNRHPCPFQPCPHGIYYAGTNSLIDGNVIHGYPQYGMQNFVTGGGVHNNTIRNNTFHSNNTSPNVSGGGLFVGAGDNNIVYNNLSYNNQNAGSGIEIDSYHPNGTLIFNNTIYGNGGNGIVIGGSATPQSTQIRNNIVYGNGNPQILNFSSTNTQYSGNLCSSGGSPSCQIIDNPDFVDAGGENFRLQAGSPAIDSGTTLSIVTTDILGITRPQGPAYDIGAYEFTAGSNTYSVSRNLSTVASGQQITASWIVSPGPAQALDWIGLVHAGDIPQNFIPLDGIGDPAWTYTQAALTGNFTIIAPFISGTFEFIYCVNDLFNCPARSATFTITAGTSATGFIVVASRWHLIDEPEATSLTDHDWIESQIDASNINVVVSAKAGGRIRYRTGICYKGVTPPADYLALHCDAGLDNWTKVADSYGTLNAKIAADSAVSMGQATTPLFALREGCTSAMPGIFTADALNTSFTIQAQHLFQFDVEYAIDIGPDMPLGTTLRCRPQHDNSSTQDFLYLIQPALKIGVGSHRITSGRFTSGVIK